MVLSHLSQDKCSLYALSLGCRNFYQAAQKHIYSSILSDKPSAHLSFFRALKAKPVLGTHTLIYCSFRWRWVFPDPEGNRELLKLSEEGFALMPNLKMLIFIEMEHYNLGRWGREWLQRCESSSGFAHISERRQNLVDRRKVYLFKIRDTLGQ